MIVLELWKCVIETVVLEVLLLPLVKAIGGYSSVVLRIKNLLLLSRTYLRRLWMIIIGMSLDNQQQVVLLYTAIIVVCWCQVLLPNNQTLPKTRT